MEQIEVSILDRTYRLAVSPEDKPALLDAVRRVDERMRAIRDQGRLSGTERIAVMAALQFAHEALDAPAPSPGTAGPARDADWAPRTRRMTEAIETELKRQESLF